MSLPAPFHGVVYPDGHPWDIREIQALLGDKAFAALKNKMFQVEYFDGPFTTSKKTSVCAPHRFRPTGGGRLARRLGRPRRG